MRRAPYSHWKALLTKQFGKFDCYCQLLFCTVSVNCSGPRSLTEHLCNFCCSHFCFAISWCRTQWKLHAAEISLSLICRHWPPDLWRHLTANEREDAVFKTFSTPISPSSDCIGVKDHRWWGARIWGVLRLQRMQWVPTKTLSKNYAHCKVSLMPKAPDKADECHAPILHLEIFNGTGMTSVVSKVF